MNQQQRKFWYPKIVYHYHKEACNGCGVCIYPSYALVLPEIPILISKLKLNYWIYGTKNKSLCTILYIDHIDNDDSHNELDNFQLLCPSCNVIKNPKKVGSSFKRSKSPEMERGDKQELEFRNWIHKQVIDNDWILEDDAIDGGAEYLTDFEESVKTISPATTRRYLSKLVSITGQYARRSGYITFKFKVPQLDKWLQTMKDNKDKRIEKTRSLTESYE